MFDLTSAWPVTAEKIARWADKDQDLVSHCRIFVGFYFVFTHSYCFHNALNGFSLSQIITLREGRLALEAATAYPLELYPLAHVSQLLYRLQRHRRLLTQSQSYLQEEDNHSHASSSSSSSSHALVRHHPSTTTNSSSNSSSVTGQPHILEWTLQDMVQDVARLVHQAARTSLLPNALLEVSSLYR